MSLLVQVEARCTESSMSEQWMDRKG